MATYVRSIRQGLPRWHGGAPWPPAGDAPDADAAVNADSVVAEHAVDMSADAAMPAATLTAEMPTGLTKMKPAAAPTVAQQAATAAPAGGLWPIRRGLPRVAGGEPWPPSGAAGMPAAAASVVAAAPAAAATSTRNVATQAAAAEQATAAATTPTAGASDHPLRRGLPRVKGGNPWPLAGFVPARVVAKSGALVAPDEVAPAPTARVEVTPAAAASVPAPSPTRSAAPTRPSAPVRPRPATAPAREPGRFGAFTGGQLLGLALIGGFALLFAAMVAVVSAAWFRNLPVMQDFLTTYPGEYHLPDGATPGFPVWVQWQHFFNVFLMVLIIRSGLQVRTEKRPTAFWTPRWSKNGRGKISLALWFHQSLDVLWLLNGVIFVVMLFITGHWMRIVPTSWEVFPNAFSAALQYLSLNWPTENGWVNYNSLQQIMYFLTVFIAAPVAAITGVRMSGMWPKNAKTLNRIYPVELARAIHFPVMLYFVAFIIVHVALVFATGALRNLNHMYGGTDVMNWAGFWIFFVSLLIIVGGWIAARPILLAPIARLSGKVSAR
ncbi:cytochrome b/b6 domain-containing protein [Diaminobutyricimonas sp. LJ205]|uniref:cytochrome b/b6 domain-containing protein n=1 Tax=Diaminobutyricimonas sp. LJ205 TaxID=2683590 RepID=UPI0012F4913F|nr:cytochrome b/b6 domain-containing protein [Diaminobutyricimonas sp. LJ205]